MNGTMLTTILFPLFLYILWPFMKSEKKAEASPEKGHSRKKSKPKKSR